MDTSKRQTPGTVQVCPHNIRTHTIRNADTASSGDGRHRFLQWEEVEPGDQCAAVLQRYEGTGMDAIAGYLGRILTVILSAIAGGLILMMIMATVWWDRF